MNGQALFVAKGCVVYHNHDQARQGFTGLTTDIGPDLSQVYLSADYLQTWLEDPATVRPETFAKTIKLGARHVF